MAKEKIKSLETISELEKQIEENRDKVRELKRAESCINLQIAVEKINSTEESDMREILRACYNFIAQHRALYKAHRFKKLDGRDQMQDSEKKEIIKGYRKQINENLIRIEALWGNNQILKKWIKELSD